MHPKFAPETGRPAYFQLVQCREQEAKKLHTCIKHFGGICKPTGDDLYNPEGTHLVVGTGGPKDPSGHKGSSHKPTPLVPKVISYLAAGKPVVRPEFVYDSADCGGLLDPEKYVAEYTRKSRDYVSALDRPFFGDWCATVILSDPLKRNAFEKVLEAGGARVQKHLNPRSLTTTPVARLRELNMVFTEPSILQNADFSNFLNSSQRGNWNIRVYSYYYFVRYAIDPESDQRRLDYFDIFNPKLLQVLHNPQQQDYYTKRRRYDGLQVVHTPNAAGRIHVGDPSNSSSSMTRRKLPKPRPGPVETIQLDSSDDEKEDEDDDMEQPTRKKAVRMTKQMRRELLARPDSSLPLEPVIIDLTGDSDDEKKDDDDDGDIQIVDEVKRNQRAELVTILESSSEPEPESSDSDDEEEEEEEDKRERNDPVVIEKPMETKLEDKSKEVRLEKESSTVAAKLREGETGQKEVGEQVRMDSSAGLDADGRASMVASEETGVEKIDAITTAAESAGKETEDKKIDLNGRAKVAGEQTEADEKGLLDTASEVEKVAGQEAEDEKMVTGTTSEDKLASRKHAQPSIRYEEKRHSKPPQKETRTSEEINRPGIKAPQQAGPGPMLANTEDAALLGAVLSTYVHRQRDSNECIDLENLKCRTFRYDRRHDDRTGRKRSREKSNNLGAGASMKRIERLLFFDALEKEREDDDDGQDQDKVLKSLLLFLPSLTDIVDCYTFPPADMMNKLLVKFLLDRKNEEATSGTDREPISLFLAKRIQAFFLHVLCLHPPVTERGRLYYARIFSLNFRKEGPTKQSSAVCRDVWHFCLHVLKRCSTDPSDVKAHLALELLLLVSQKDLEYWWKHVKATKDSGKDEQVKPFVSILFESTWMDNKVERRVRDFLKECISNKTPGNPMLHGMALKFLAMAALLASSVDKEKNMATLSLKGSVKCRLANVVCEVLDRQKEERRFVLSWLMLLRPSWLGLSVSSAVLRRRMSPAELTEGSLTDLLTLELDALTIGDEEEEERGEKTEQRDLVALVLDKTLATFGYHVFHGVLAAHQNKSSKKGKKVQVPYSRMSKLRPSDNREEMLDSRVALSQSEVLSGIDLINAVHKEVAVERARREEREGKVEEEEQERKAVNALGQLLKSRLTI